jgi:hypothetical protein
MHKKYASEGLAAVSVSLDDPSDKAARGRVETFLKTQKAIFTNLILDEPVEGWQKQLGIDGPPVVFVYGRDGKLAKKFTEDFEYADVEKLAQELLKKK